jgi:hypothetical protein
MQHQYWTSSNANDTTLERCGEILNSRVTTTINVSVGNIIFTSLSALTQFTLLFVLFLRRRRLRTYRSSFSLESHLLPVHILFLRLSVVVYLLQVVSLIIPGLGGATHGTARQMEGGDFKVAITKGIVWGLQHFCIDGIAVVLCQSGIGRRAVRETIQWITPWAIFTALVVGLSCYASIYSVLVIAIYYLIQTIFYIVVGSKTLRDKFTCCGCHNLTPRPAFHRYAWTWIALRCMAFITDGIGIFDSGSGTCLNFAIVQTSFITVVPIAIFVAFKEDTAFWYGYAYAFVATNENDTQKKKRSNHQGATDIRRPLLGLSLPDDALLDINQGIEDLEKKDIISFAELSIDVSSLLGAGGVSKVFPGTCRGKKAAFKLVFVVEITSETIQGFFKEASLLRRCAAHPNIVNIIGVCIAPPSLCHVLELCDGTLHDTLEEKRCLKEKKMLNAVGKRMRNGFELAEEKNGGGSGGLDLSFFAECSLQCARAVAFLHSRSILHRDLKSLNFLVKTGEENEMIIKLADMDQAVELIGQNVSVYIEPFQSHPESIIGTPQWAAPEVLLQKVGSSTMAADVFALGCVCWECLTLKAPFASRSPREVIRLVSTGVRLQLPERGLPEIVKEMLKRCWLDDVEARPTSQELVVFFESLQ